MSRVKAKKQKPLSRIKASPIPDDLIYFSFKYLITTNNRFKFDKEKSTYFCNLIQRLKVVSNTTTKTFTTTKGRKSLRAHRIDWQQVSENGFNISGLEQFNDEAWQFAISANEGGRIHGSLIDNIFYIIWIDPKHNLYSK